MRKLVYSLSGLILAAGAAHAQPAEGPNGAIGAEAHGAAHAAPATPADPALPPEPATPADPADPVADADAEPALPPDAATPAEPATPADPAVPPQAAAVPTAPPIAASDVSEAEVDSFAQATVKLQAIQADATIATEQKQAAMQAAVTEAGLDPATYNAIGKAAQADPTLRARVQTAMTRHAAPSDG